MRRILFLITTILTLVFALSFAVINAHSVKLNFYLGSTDVPLALLLVLTLGIGILSGALVMLSVIMNQKLELSKLRKSARNCEKELSNLRSMPVKENR